MNIKDPAFWLKQSKKIFQKLDVEISPIIGNKDAAKSIGIGSDGTITSVIDERAENLIIEHIKSLGIACNIQTEEKGWITVGDNPEIILIVDPIEGTYNSKRRIFPTCSMIGVADGPDITDMFFGAYYIFDNQEFYHVIKGEGAYHDGTRIKSSQETQIDKTFIGVDSYFSRTYQGEHLYQEARNYGTVSIHDLYASEGRLDGMLNAYQRRVHDMAVPLLFLKESGAIVTDFKGNEITGPIQGDETKTTTIAAGNKELYNKMKNMIDEAEFRSTDWKYI